MGNGLKSITKRIVCFKRYKTLYSQLSIVRYFADSVCGVLKDTGFIVLAWDQYKVIQEQGLGALQ